METKALALDLVEEVIAAVVRPGNFFLGRGMGLVWEHLPNEEVRWEIFHGRLLEPAHTRQQRTFSAWNIYHKDGNHGSLEPLLSLKLDAEARRVHVTRSILCHAWEGYDAGDHVIMSRETIRWIPELVGSICLDEFRDGDGLRDELARRMLQAVIGTSRLPLTSVEAPLPAFSLGQLVFFDLRSTSSSPLMSYQELIEAGLAADLSGLERAKLLETILRTVRGDEVAEAARHFAHHWKQRQSMAEIPPLLRALFNEVSLSPWTLFVENTLAFVQILVSEAQFALEDQADFLGYLLRQLGRHLIAYDLVTFHHQGANYPDALLLDAVLKACLGVCERCPGLFMASGTDSDQDIKARLRRRALRQGCLTRWTYEGHLVPDAPSSPGENARVLPSPHVRVPEEQLLQPALRTKRLYAGDSLADLIGQGARQLLQQCFEDLHEPAELRELGMAVFIDRPLGAGKAPGEPDQTPLLGHEAFSRSVAQRRIHQLGLLARELGLSLDLEPLQERLRSMTVPGLPIHEVAGSSRPAVSLADAVRVADDFVVLRTLPAGLNQVLDLVDAGALAAHFPSVRQIRLIVRIRDSGNPHGALTLFDDSYQKRMELEADTSLGFTCRGGIEFPVAGLRVGHVWSAAGKTM